MNDKQDVSNTRNKRSNTVMWIFLAFIAYFLIIYSCMADMDMVPAMIHMTIIRVTGRISYGTRFSLWPLVSRHY